MKVGNSNKVNDVNGARAHGTGVASGRTGTGEASQVVIKRKQTSQREVTRREVTGGRLRVTTANVGTMVGRSREVVEMLGRRKVDICCVQEVQYRGEGCRVFGEGEDRYKFWWSGEKKDKRGGVGLLVREDLVQDVMEIQRLTTRIMSIKMLVGRKILQVFSVYAPQGGRPQEEKEEFWELLDDSVGKIAEDDLLIIGGDLNGHVGTVRDGFEEIMGIYGYGERNTDGENILEFCQGRRLRILNSMFKKEREKKVTYKSGGVETQIDYILARKNERMMIRDCKVIPGEECLTQHRLVCSDIKITGMKKKVRKSIEKRIKEWKLQDETVRTKFEESVAKRMEKNEGGWENLRDCVLEAGREICGQTTGNFRSKRETWWWNETVQRVIREKKGAYKKWQKSGEENDRIAYKQKKKQSKKEIASAKRNVWDEWMKISGDSKKKGDLFKIAKQMKRERQEVVGGRYVKDSKGEIKVEEKEIMERWREYFEKLLNEQNEYQINNTDKVEGPVIEITAKEVEAALKRMKKGKAAGPTRVTCDLLQATGRVGVRELTNIMNHLLAGKEVPHDWKSSNTIPIYKGKGDAMDCGKYRGVRLLEHGMKVYEYVLEKRLRELVEIGKYQFGFCQGRSTTGAIFILRQLQEKYSKKKKKLYHIFVDLEKAFDRVPRGVIEWALRRKGIPEQMVAAIMALYVGTRTRVKTVAGISREFGIGVGVHQGSILSPLLFIIVMDEVTRDARKGVPWEVVYADDLVLTEESEQEVLEAFERWRGEMELRGLKVNLEKTKVMVTGKETNQMLNSGKWPCGCCGKGVGTNSIMCFKCNKWCHQRCSGLKRVTGVQNFKCPKCIRGIDRVELGKEGLVIEDGRIEEVHEFCYLGDVLDCDAGVERAVRARVAAAWKKWREMASLLINKSIPLKIRGSVYESCIRSVMLYGAETWAMTDRIEVILKRCDRRMLRYMAGVRWQDKISSREVAERCGVKEIQEKIRQRRLQWFGHVRREKEGGVVRMVEEMEVPGKRPVGRPRRTWRQIVQQDMEKLGIQEELAQDRGSWRRIIASPTPVKGKEGL